MDRKASHEAMAKSREASRRRQAGRLAKGKAAAEAERQAAESRATAERQHAARAKLEEAILRADDETASTLVPHVLPEFLLAPGPDGTTLLHAAAAGGLPKCCAVILGREDVTAAAVNAADAKGRCPLHCAAVCGDPVTCQTIASDRRCDLWAVEANDKSACDIARDWGFADAAATIMEEIEARGAAAICKRREAAQTAAEKAAHEHAMVAAERAKDRGHDAGLNSVADERIADALDLLLDVNWPFVNQVDARGRSLLHHAALRGEEALCAAVLGREDFELTDTFDRDRATALHVAAANRHPEVCACIIGSDRCENVNALDINDQTALHLAAVRNDEESYSAIVQHADCDDTLEDKRGKTAPQYAEERGMDVAWKFKHLFARADEDESDDEGGPSPWG